MALVAISCGGCGHSGVVKSATLPRIVACSACGYARRVERAEGYAVRGWANNAKPKAAKATCVAAPPVSVAAQRTPIAARSERLTDSAIPTASAVSANDQPASLQKVADPTAHKDEQRDRRMAILARHFASHRV